MLRDKYQTTDNLIKDINSKLSGYRGYVQFSHRALADKDIFENNDPDISTDEDGFVYEAHFANKNSSVTIRQQNSGWIVSKTDIKDIEDSDIEYFYIEKTKYLNNIKATKIKMAQIWKDFKDPLCEGLVTQKLKKVVFAGFEKGENS